MFRVQPSHTIAVALLDHIRRKFEQGVRLQADLTRRNIGIVALQENIDTSKGSAAAKFFRRSTLAQGAYQADSASELINLVQNRARADKHRIGRPPALIPEYVERCRGMADECAGL